MQNRKVENILDNFVPGDVSSALSLSHTRVGRRMLILRSNFFPLCFRLGRIYASILSISYNLILTSLFGMLLIKGVVKDPTPLI